MDNLDAIANAIRDDFEAQDLAREAALKQSRELTRHCADAIRAVHRRRWEVVETRLATAKEAADALHASVAGFPSLEHAGYTQDALKEYVEAVITYALVRDEGTLPTPDALGVPSSTYLNGMAEAATELRRHILDIIRTNHSDEAERLLAAMDAIYDVLVTFNFPDAITGGLRRRTDAVRGVLERTRGDLTHSLRQERLQAALHRLEERLGVEE